MIEIESPDFTQYQLDFLYNKERFTCVEASTKTGKTFSMMFWIYEYSHGIQNKKKVLHIKQGMNFWWVAPVYSQAKIAFDRLWNVVGKSGLYNRNKAELTITTPLGSVIHFKTAQDPDNLYGEDVYACVFDEYTRSTEEAWFALRSTLTATKAPCKFIGNYKGSANWGHKLAMKSKNDSNYAYFRITAWDAVRAGILDEEEVLQAQRDLPPFMFKALYLAEGDVDNSRLIADSAIQNLLTNTFVKHGKKYITADLAFQGSDKFVIMVWSGYRLIDITVIDKSDGKEVETMIKSKAHSFGVARSDIAYDSDGVGIYLQGYLKGAVMFKNGGAPFKESSNKVEYRNLKSQCEFRLAKIINNNEMFFDCDVSEYWQAIQEELEVIKNRGLDEEGKLETLRKKEIIEIIGRSPDHKDTLMMRIFFDLKPDYTNFMSRG